MTRLRPSELNVKSDFPDTTMTIHSSGGAWVELWRYRRFIIGSVVREFRSRYSRSLLGGLWLLLAPFAMILIYTIVFSKIMQTRLPGVSHAYSYSIYLCAGLLPWQWFSELLSRNTTLFIDNAGLIKKNSFPRMTLPLICFLASGLNFMLISIVFLAFLTLSGSLPGGSIIWVLPLLLLQGVLGSGLGFCLGVLNVFFRDVGQAVGIILQFWFWLTPIIYPLEVLPERLQGYLGWNPVTPLTQAYQQIFVWHEAPQWTTLWPVLALTILTTVLAIYLYRAARNQLTDEL